MFDGRKSNPTLSIMFVKNVIFGTLVHVLVKLNDI